MLPRSRPASMVYLSAMAASPRRRASFRELRQHVVEEEGQPDAFALAVLADQIHAVIPVAATHQGQAVGAEAQGRCRCARTQCS